MATKTERRIRRAHLAVGGFNAVVALMVAATVYRVWPRDAAVLLALVPLAPTVAAVLVPRLRWLSLAAAVPNALIFIGGLVYLGLLLTQTLPYFHSHAVGITLLLSVGAMNFATVFGQYRQAPTLA